MRVGGVPNRHDSRAHRDPTGPHRPRGARTTIGGRPILAAAAFLGGWSRLKTKITKRSQKWGGGDKAKADARYIIKHAS